MTSEHRRTHTKLSFRKICQFTDHQADKTIQQNSPENVVLHSKFVINKFKIFMAHQWMQNMFIHFVPQCDFSPFGFCLQNLTNSNHCVLGEWREFREMTLAFSFSILFSSGGCFLTVVDNHS